ncbi:PEGA domain-containing protein [Methanofollis aquaemaris]|uniref:PEGA domain-containing protein n=1 Tax=Methanofollis aquaemaris TaxID=126734 RepID=UPI00223F0AEA|nr:PEGA domain-containing protein [Methanofollis aquaemaris]
MILRGPFSRDANALFFGTISLLPLSNLAPGDHISIESSYQGTTSETTGLLTIPDAPAGTRQVKVVKNDYAPYIATVTIVADRTTTLSATLNNDDLKRTGCSTTKRRIGLPTGSATATPPIPTSSTPTATASPPTMGMIPQK